MRPIAIRYVRDIGVVRPFYEALGLDHVFSERPNRRGQVMWTELSGDGGKLALHPNPDEDGADHPPLGLSFESGEPLEDVIRRLRAAGYEPETEIVDEAFGRSFRVRDPEGVFITVNEHDRTI